MTKTFRSPLSAESYKMFLIPPRSYSGVKCFLPGNLIKIQWPRCFVGTSHIGTCCVAVTKYQTSKRKAGVQLKSYSLQKQLSHNEPLLISFSGNHLKIQVPRCQPRANPENRPLTNLRLAWLPFLCAY